MGIRKEIGSFMAADLKRKRILVTGSGGFLGGHFTEELRRHGYRRLLAPTHAACDLRDPARIRRIFRAGRPQIVVHLAARVGGIGANREKPGLFFYENLVMGVQLMEEARRCGVEKFVSVGTVCSYPKFARPPFREADLWNGYPEETNAPYGLAKKMLLVQGQAYRAQYGFNAIHLIPVNLYGPHDDTDPRSSHVIPALIRKVFEAQRGGRDEIVVWGDGNASREFLYVADCARGLRLAMERYDGGEPVNLGTGREITIKALAALIAKLMGFRGRLAWDKTQPNGQPRRCLDVSRAARTFGFRAATPLEAGLKKTIAWYLREFGRA
jgi:GDP-L-fucose synthase